MLTASTRLGPYEIVAPLGKGGMGEVYRARDTRLGREVALKVLPQEFANNAEYLSRFEREAKAVAALSHPNILAIHDYGTDGAVTYAVMELLEGETLRSRLTKGSLPWREAVEYGAAIADGLTAAHVKGIVHRDIKPENLFLTLDGRVKILDFGLASISRIPDSPTETTIHVPAMTGPGMVMGTVGYMSPEQVRGQRADACSDLFSFGCVLYEMVTGKRAFQRESAAETMTAILHDQPSDPTDSGAEISPELGRVIRQCLAKNRNARLQSARDLALSLRATATDRFLQQPAADRHFSLRLVGIAAALLMIVAIAVSMNVPTRNTRPSDPSFLTRDAKAINALAVLPFENVGGDPKTEYLSDGVADHLINSLSQLRRNDLQVRPFTSIARHSSKQTDLPTLGRDLKVNLIVTGTLRQQGDELYISVALVDAPEDKNLWGNRYQGKLGAIMDLQDQIVRDVAANLQLSLTDEDDKRLTKRYTADPEAYLLYREAIYHRGKITEQGFETAIDYCQRAVKKDQKFALAHATMGACYVGLGSLFRGPKETYPEAKKHLARALEIDNTLPEAHAAMGLIYLFHDWNWAAAERELKQGIALESTGASWNPSFYGFYLAAMDRLPEALISIRRSQELDPLAAAPNYHVTECYNRMRQYDQAIAEARKTLELDPKFVLAYGELGLAYSQKGMHENALEMLNKGKGSPSVRGLLGYAHARAGHVEEARQVLEELKGLAKEGQYGCAFGIVRIHAALGENDEAFKWLQTACDERSTQVIWLKVDPTLESLRADPRFAQVVKDMGLPP